jgi:hypothetical protein
VRVVTAENARLAQAWARTGWSRWELARRVNERARRRGLVLNTDASRVRNWLGGQHPQPPVPELLCELFSEHLGHPVIPSDLGLRATADDELGLRYAASIAATVVTVAELGRNDMRRRDFLSNGSFLAVASVAPSRDWLLATLDATRPRTGSKIGELQVKAIRDAFVVFHEAQTLRGTHARRALAQYVTQQVLPLLHDVDP